MKRIFNLILFCSLAYNVNAQVDTTASNEIAVELRNEILKLNTEIQRIDSAILILERNIQVNHNQLESINNQITTHSSQFNEFDTALTNLRNQNNELVSELNSIESILSTQNQQVDSLRSISSDLAANIIQNTEELNSKIEETGDVADEKISSLDAALSKNTLYWISAFITVLFLSGLVYLILKRRIISDKSELDQQILNTKKALEEEGLHLDNKLIELLQTQLKLMEEEKSSTEDVDPEEMDHSLALKVADEISRIQMNLNHMDPSTKGLKQLDRAVNSIVDNFQANGYEIPDLLNKPYDSGMNVVATMEPDENLEKDQQIIKRIIKPQVNYKGVMIQAAQAVVAYGE